MSRPFDDPELRAVAGRYAAPGRRYLRLGGAALRLEGDERRLFLAELARAAAEITPAELAVLFDGGWRERRTAAWLVAVAGRVEFRERIGELLLASEGPYAGSAYCVALAGFGGDADAELFCDYLDRYLPRLDLHYDQGVVLGSLLHLDGRLGAARAARYLGEDGLWERWIDVPARRGPSWDPERFRTTTGVLRAFAVEAAAFLP
ncbi:DUF6000 family protein [Kitasatospora sp. NPDC004289]